MNPWKALSLAQLGVMVLGMIGAVGSSFFGDQLSSIFGSVGSAPHDASSLDPDLLNGPLLIRKLTMTREHSVPDKGYGLYVYILPQPEINNRVLKSVLDYHYCLFPVASEDRPTKLALFLLPMRSQVTGPENVPSIVDTELAHNLMRTVYDEAKIDPTELYIVATNQPLVVGRIAAPAVVISLGRIAPQYVGTWLLRLQSLVEQRRIERPDDLELQVRSALATIGAFGKLVGIEPAEASEFRCSTSAITAQ